MTVVSTILGRSSISQLFTSWNAFLTDLRKISRVWWTQFMDCGSTCERPSDRFFKFIFLIIGSSSRRCRSHAHHWTIPCRCPVPFPSFRCPYAMLSGLRPSKPKNSHAARGSCRIDLSLTDLSVNRSGGHQVKQSVNQTVSRSINRSINRAVNHFPIDSLNCV